MGRSRLHRRQQRQQRREYRLRVLLQPPPMMPVHSGPATENRVPNTIYSTEYLVSYCYKNWHNWCARAQNELARRQAETERPYTQREDTTLNNLQQFTAMMVQV